MKNHIIAFIGAGNMANSLIGGLIADGFDAKNIWASAPTPEFLVKAQEFGAHTTSDNKTAAQQADVIVFAVKPQILKTVATELADIIKTKNPLIISVAAGVRATDLRNWLGEQAAIVRCMPNTPALIRCGATGLYANSQVTAEQKNLAESILRAVGITVWLENEAHIDTVTALSGSGPAYFFLVMEALETAATKLGLSADAAHLLTLQTALGAARMAIESTESVSKLRHNVTSPGGTTECALKILENGRLTNLFAEAVQGAAQRAVELAAKFGK